MFSAANYADCNPILLAFCMWLFQIFFSRKVKFCLFSDVGWKKKLLSIKWQIKFISINASSYRIYNEKTDFLSSYVVKFKYRLVVGITSSNILKVYLICCQIFYGFCRVKLVGQIRNKQFSSTPNQEKSSQIQISPYSYAMNVGFQINIIRVSYVHCF